VNVNHPVSEFVDVRGKFTLGSVSRRGKFDGGASASRAGRPPMPHDGPFASCLICASTDTQDVATNRSLGVNIFRCKTCGFVQSEYVSGRSLGLYYANFYRGRLDQGGLAGHRLKGKAQANSQIAYLHEQQPSLKVGAALDYGTAEGSLGHGLRAIADKVYVTEMDPQFVELLKTDPDLTFVDHNELAAERFESFFDLICISHVLEHLADPYEVMDLFATLLKPGGLLLVDIPNEVRMLAQGFQAKGHLSYFTKDAFSKFVDVQGCFDILEIRTCNREVDFFIASRFTAPEEYSIPVAKDGTTIRALLRCREPAQRRKGRTHAFNESALLNEYSARILLYYHLLSATQARVAQVEQELNRIKGLPALTSVGGNVAA
jgi:2-polyprenyl-3-methyl-5-hydroxy-6-metoxy-1,4-benzoquinol methylase